MDRLDEPAGLFLSASLDRGRNRAHLPRSPETPPEHEPTRRERGLIRDRVPRLREKTGRPRQATGLYEAGSRDRETEPADRMSAQPRFFRNGGTR
jgi:hypothetical protein